MVLFPAGKPHPPHPEELNWKGWGLRGDSPVAGSQSSAVLEMSLVDSNAQGD